MKWKLLILCNALAFLLLFSLFGPWPIWAKIDIGTFKLMNGSLEGRPLWQLFWAFANHRYHDWLEDLVVLAFFLFYIFQATKKKRAERTAQFIFCLLFTGLVIYLVNRQLLHSYLVFYRDSPSLLNINANLSDQIPWLTIKEHSDRSFPADHATTAIFFAAIYTYYAGWRLGKYLVFYAVFLCLPRLFAGAHWLSDVIVGSGSIALVFISWAFCTPFQEICCKKIEKGVHHFTAFMKKWCSCNMGK